MPTHNDGKLRVLYIGGMGRSGSTLLERALAQLPHACGAGEVIYLWERGIANDELCGCGERFSGCSFWQRVGKAAFDGWENVDTERIGVLARRVDDVKHVPRLMAHRAGSSFAADVREYVEYYERLYSAIREISGCEVIIDSSKITSLAYVLTDSQTIDLRLVQIVRDPRGVAYSWTKKVPRPEITAETSVVYMPRHRPAYNAMLYSGHNALLGLLARKGVPSLRVRYEDFVSDPMATVELVASFAGLPFLTTGLRGADERHLNLQGVHSVSGNPSRFQVGEVEVRADERWRTQMPLHQKALVSVLTLPARAAYGYIGSTRPDAPAVARPPAVIDTWPSVGVVVPTHARPEEMRRAVSSILNQDYPGEIQVVVVYDKATVETSLPDEWPGRSVTVMANSRTPGLAGARNTGFLCLETDLLASCDDDDRWEPGKLKAQVEALLAQPRAQFVTTGMVVDYGDRSIVRLAHEDRVTYPDLLRSRMAMLHSSSFVMRREALLDEIGLVDEEIPRSFVEDWDLLLRAARLQPIVHVDRPLTRVQWGPNSYFAQEWQLLAEAAEWMLERHPIHTEPQGHALFLGKLAFYSAMMKRRRRAISWAIATLRVNRREPRAYLALAIASGVVRGGWLMDQLNRRGHGI